ncbi:universal stress protein [Agilicoccus flavus]|uniref:universal stress protein n=1 Tax=Agilicoccus flavus TaxID=2775968 RepID=UPI001CF6D98D|nr:universal stress protein [Agilicoccus flavus]
MAVVVGYVPTKEGRAALRRAAEECRLRSTKLVVVSSARGGRNLDSKDVAQFDSLLDEVRGMLAESSVEHEERQFVRGNEPAEDLIAVADEVGADMIVIGLRKRTPVGKLLLGSNAQRILLEASCAVLAVKAEDD